ncbi:MAG: serine hydrolase [Deinococcales bacterium]
MRTWLVMVALLTGWAFAQPWPASTPEEQGFDAGKLADAVLTMRERSIDIHSLLLMRHGAVFVDASFYPYDGTTVHEVASVTKSVMTTLVGIAAEQRKLDLDAPMLSFFPDREVAHLDARKERITVRHLVSMASGLECTAANDEQTLKEMQAAPDMVQFTLDRRMAAEPGTTFVYCSPGMHVLSAIVQKATGMTALAFARANLFEPLGIEEVLWNADAQGHNWGWSNLYLHLQDMAKLGQLWLQQGQWQGRQIVSPSWVAASVASQMDVPGDDDDYGYGWWVSPGEPPSFYAMGRGGQRIVVVPAWNLVVVTTGGGLDWDEIEPLLTSAVVDLEHPLPADPTGTARLREAVAAVATAPAPKPVAAFPAMAREISGRTYVFDTNPLGITALALEFGTGDEGRMQIVLTGAEGPQVWPIGLDGVYRMSQGPYGLPQGLRGSWLDERTFAFEYDNIANNDHLLYRLHFDGDRVVMEGRETAHELGARFEGHAEHR